MVPDNPGAFIVHAIPPFALIRAELGQHQPDTLFVQYAFRNMNGVIEDWTLYIHYIETSKDDTAKLLDKAWRWYRAYLEWEDQQHGKTIE